MPMAEITSEIGSLIDRALAEDLGTGDPTTDSLISPTLTGEAHIAAKAQGVLAGIDVALAVMKRADGSLDTRVLLRDGTALKPGDVVASVSGPVASILKAERTALNFLMRLSGIATETNRYVQAVDGQDARIADTRKTTPGLRSLEKYAVKVGGGQNHRQNLGDGVLIKDNHIQALRDRGLTLREIIEQARRNVPHTLKVEVEVEDLDEVKEALDGGAEILLLDNMRPEEMAEAVSLSRGRAITEASGGINLETVRSVAATGVDLISVGALTHSARALDMSLDLVSVAVANKKE